jgi:cytoskeletal protein RodZ
MGTGPSDIPPTGEPEEEPTVETPAVGGEPTQMLPAAGAAAGGPGGTAGPTDGDGADKRNRRKLILILLGVFVLGLAVGGLVFALVRDDGSGSSATATTTTSESSSSTSTSSSSSSSSTTSSTSATTVPIVVPTTESTVPRFTQFDATPNPVTCKVVNPEASTVQPPSSPDVTINWSTVFAATVDVSIDGTGVYQSNIGAQGSLAIPFGCPGPHTYTLTAHGTAGTSTNKSVVVTSHP